MTCNPSCGQKRLRSSTHATPKAIDADTTCMTTMRAPKTAAKPTNGVRRRSSKMAGSLPSRAIGEFMVKKLDGACRSLQRMRRWRGIGEVSNADIRNPDGQTPPKASKRGSKDVLALDDQVTQTLKR
jgi:hypothetical protein